MRGLSRLIKRSVIAGAGVALAATVGAVALTVTATSSNAATCQGYVALTFDDGPNATNTKNLLDALKLAKLRATMFNLGQNAKSNPALVRLQVEAGMWVGNHSWSHPHMTNLDQAQMKLELSQTQDAIKAAGVPAPTIFRPPYGETNATLKKTATQLGLTQVTWDVDSQDWNGASATAIIQAASRLRSGQIMLMHDQYQSTLQAIPRIAAELSSRNLCPGMISATTGRAVAPVTATR